MLIDSLVRVSAKKSHLKKFNLQTEIAEKSLGNAYEYNTSISVQDVHEVLPF